MSLILTLDNTGQPDRWATWQEAVIYQAKNLVSWSTGEVEFTFHGGTSRMTGKQSSITVPSILALKNKHYKKHRPPVLTNKNLFRRDLSTCAYCGHKFNEVKLTRDHIHPVSKGGKDSWMNCVTACKGCNNHKDNLLLADIGMDLLYVPYVPSQIENLILQNRKILADQMAFIQAYIPEHSRAHQLLNA